MRDDIEKWLEASDIVEPLQLFWKDVFKKNRIGSKFDRLQRHRAINFGKFVYTLSPFHHVSQVSGKHFRIRTFWTAKLFLWRHLYYKKKKKKKKKCRVNWKFSALWCIWNNMYLHFFPTFMGAFPVIFVTKKFMAISSQFMCSSTHSLMSPGIAVVYK